MNSAESITYRSVFMRWIPLALSWSLMSLELPLVQSIISSLPESHINLAAVGIVFAICLMCESPILMLVSASAALVKDWTSFSRLRIFALSLSFLMSVIFGILTLLLHYSGLLLEICSNNPLLEEKVFDACLVSLLIPFVVGNRRFYQGVLIRSGKSHLLTIGTATRLFLIFFTGFLLTSYSSWHGALIGAAAGVSGMLGESFVVTLLSAGSRSALKSSGPESQTLDYPAIFRFYTPLAVSGVVNLSILPVLTFFMSQAPEPVKSLAAYQVFQGMIFFLSALALGMQEVVVSMLGVRHQGYRVIRNFTVFLALAEGLFFAIYIFSPLSAFFLLDIVRIKEDLFAFLYPVLIIALPLPVLTVISVAMRAVVVVARRTRWVTIASAAELLIVLAVMLLMQHFTSLSGLWNSVIALLSARIASCLVLARIFLQLRSELRSD